MKLNLILQIFLVASLSPLFCHAQSENDAEARAIKQLEEAKINIWLDDEGHANGVCLDQESSLEDLKLLSALTHLESLLLNEFGLSSEGLQYIKSLDWLKEFSANGSKFTDAEVQHLAGMNQLEILDLSETAITDASIDVFSKLPSLKNIKLDSTAVTADGLKKLKTSRPDLEIVKHWKYFCGFQDGRAVLDIERVFIFFPDKDVKGGIGGGGGGSIRVSTSREDVMKNSKSSGGGGGLFNRISVSVKQKKDGAVFSIEDHTIEIRKEGTELIIDGESFPIPDKYLSVTIDSNGIGKPQTHDKRPLPK